MMRHVTFGLSHLLMSCCLFFEMEIKYDDDDGPLTLVILHVLKYYLTL